ncbi:MAG: hypothetical protein ABWY36_02100, partial [Leifsonia sp.]
FAVADLDATACATFTRASSAPLSKVYVAAPTGTAAWLATDGKYVLAGNVRTVPAGAVVLRIDSRTFKAMPRG